MSELFSGEAKLTDKHLFVDTPVLPYVKGGWVFCNTYSFPREKTKVYKMKRGYRVRFDRD